MEKITIQDFEKKIQEEISEKLYVKENPNNDMAGVFHEDLKFSLCGIAKDGLFEETTKRYKNEVNMPHRGWRETIEKINKSLSRLEDLKKQEKSFLEATK